MIPRIIHHVWPSDTQPFADPVMIRLRASWMRHHPDWDFAFWRLEDLPLDRFLPGSVEIVLDPSQTVVAKSNVIRLEILSIQGGVYVDTDLECLRPMHGFMAGKAILCDLDADRVWGCVLGFPSGDPVVAQCLNAVVTATQHVRSSSDVGGDARSKTPLMERIISPVIHGSDYPVMPASAMSLPDRAMAGACWMHHRMGRRPDGWQHLERFS